jgi:hypothetical protein
MTVLSFRYYQIGYRVHHYLQIFYDNPGFAALRVLLIDGSYVLIVGSEIFSVFENPTTEGQFADSMPDQNCAEGNPDNSICNAWLQTPTG